MANNSNITFDGAGSILLEALTSVSVQGVIFGSTFVNFNNKEISGLNVVAKFG
ncbi:MAG: hypothetical protein ACOX0T_10815 [Pelotomaculum sp.]